jgi:fatty-acyl-CoA synthase
MNAIPRPLATASVETPAKAWRRALELTGGACADPANILPRLANDWARRYGAAPALIGVDQTLTFRELAERANRVSRFAIAAGVKPGETIGLLMGNRPDFFALWLGLTQIGAVVALLNFNLQGVALAHSLGVAATRRVIVDVERMPNFEAARAAGADEHEIWIYGDATQGFRQAIETFDGSELRDDEQRPAVTLSDAALLIYTSGTTGLPKAAKVSHRRIVEWSHWFAGLAGMTGEDRMYDCLPMYHSVGGVSAIGAPLVNGGSVVIAERFSARGFFDDITQHGCTAFQYIGELCRYLAKAPPSPEEPLAKLRLACGNGMSGDVWRDFARRFPYVRVLEFYAATEGNFSLYNVEGRIGAIGRMPAFQALRDPVALVRFDAETETPARGADGFCIRCAAGEVGEALGRVGAETASRFEGYRDERATQKKIMRDVFRTGDAWVRSGDLMRCDEEGFYAFVDRVGDTYRWKGENVATLEVASVLSTSPDVSEAIVYGVKAPGAEGRAGMALLGVGEDFDLAVFARHALALPSYARPVFLRLRKGEGAETTSTFKTRGRAWAAEGYDPKAIDDPLYLYDRGAGRYVRLDAEVFARLTRGEIPL